MTKFFRLFMVVLIVVPLRLLADDDDDTLQKTSALPSNPLPGEQGVIILNQAIQEAAGIKTVKLKPVSYHAEVQSYGIALSIEPILTLQSQYLTALAQQKAAQVKVNFSQTHLNRLNYLHNEQIVSTRALQDQQLSLQTDKAALTNQHYLTQQIVNNARLVWGNTLTDWLVNSTSAFKTLTQQQTTLLKVTFPPQLKSSGIKTIFAAPTGQREQAVTATLISAAPQADNFSQGQTYFYQTSAAQIKPGMRVNAWIPSQQNSQTGVIVPKTALLWHLGQAFVFVKLSTEQFVRRAVPEYSKIALGYFVKDTLKPGEEIVSTGAQLLLSQEFKGQIPNEDDD